MVLMEMKKKVSKILTKQEDGEPDECSCKLCKGFESNLRYLILFWLSKYSLKLAQC